MAISKVIYKSSVNATPEVWMDVTDTTATAPDVLQKYFYMANGVKTLGTGINGDELGYGNMETDSNLIGYGQIDSMIIDSYGYGYADYLVVVDDEEEGENDGV